MLILLMWGQDGLKGGKRMGSAVDVRGDRWIDHVSDEDLGFIKRFILASGSLKDLAAEYRISYPTVRLRLDRMIEKIRIFESEKIVSEFERQAQAMYVEGKIDLATMKKLVQVHRKELRKQSEEE
ncbi:MAG: DUF2089 family protein [Planctomycetales bacterium]